jgi:Asp-tRNA(Asn)/Glu-tRNA(Gln) amidotransferase A subunit family amidase
MPKAAAQSDSGATPSGVSRRSLLGAGGLTVAGSALGLTLGSSSASAAPAGAKAIDPISDPSILPALADIPKHEHLVDHEVVELIALMRAGRTTSLKITKAYLHRIAKFNGPFNVYGDNGLYNAFVRIDEDAALAAARAADKRLAAAKRSGEAVPLLCGIPMGVKDSVAVKGFSNQDGSPAFADNIALADATIVGRLRDAGAIIVGLTICSAFSGSISGTFAGNAWNKDYIPGGSSQGSGVAPIARLIAAAIGEETGGSITFPSAINGASGIKPSLGTVSIAGLMPLSPAYDVLGPITRSMRDSSLVLNTMLGLDPVNDPQTLSAPIPFPKIPMTPRKKRKPLTGVTIGIPQTDWMVMSGKTQVGVSPQATYGAGHLAVFNRLVGELKGMGAKVLNFPGLDITDATQNPYFSSADVLATVDGSPVSPSAAVVNANRYEVRYSDAVRDFCTSGIPTADSIATLTNQYGRKAPGATAATFDSADTFNGGIAAATRYAGEQRRRTLIANYTKALEDYGVDFMMVFSIGDVVGKRVGGGLTTYRAYYQVPNALGWPLCSFPVGYVSGLPVSAQFWGPRFSEPDIVQAALDYQAAYPDYNHVFPPNPVATTPAPTPKVKPSAIAAAPGAPEDAGPSNDPLIGEAMLKAMTP